jgi:hypothetical protein
MGGYETRVSCVGSREQHVPVGVEDMCAVVEVSIKRGSAKAVLKENDEHGILHFAVLEQIIEHLRTT